MLAKTSAIVLKSVNYGDNSCIVHMFTEEFGMQSYMVNAVRNQKGPIKPSHILPLSLVELVVYRKEHQAIHRIKELKCKPVLSQLHFDVVRNCIALFITEILDACIQGEEAHADLFNFLHHFVQILDLEDESLANIPIVFLLQLSRFLGIQPDSNYQNGFVLQLDNGHFSSREHCVGAHMNAEVSRWCNELRIADDWHSVKLPKTMRDALLDNLIEYYVIQLFPNRKIKSHLILREIL